MGERENERAGGGLIKLKKEVKKMSKAIFQLPIPIVLIIIGIMMLSEEMEKIKFEDEHLIKLTKKEFDA